MKKMMNIKLYNISKRGFKNYMKKMKQLSIQLFYINIFFFLVKKLQNFFFFLPTKLSDIFNYIIFIKENLSEENKNKTFAFFFDQINASSVEGGTSRHIKNLYYQGHFLDCFVNSLKQIYWEWLRIVDIFYNYHIFLISKQYNITVVSDDHIFDFLKTKIEEIKIMNFLKIKHFVNFRKKKKNKKKKKQNKKKNINTTIEDISNFRSLSFIHLYSMLYKYIYIWNTLYGFINVILSYLLYNNNIDDYVYFNSVYDNTKKFCICYDMILLNWRYSQIVNNRELEKVVRFLLNELNIYYCKHIKNWIKKGKIDDRFNEFFLCLPNTEEDQYNTLFVKQEKENIICPELFSSFIFYILNLGNNVRLYMKINSDQSVDYVRYYLEQKQNGKKENYNAINIKKYDKRIYNLQKPYGQTNFHTNDEFDEKGYYQLQDQSHHHVYKESYEESYEGSYEESDEELGLEKWRNDFLFYKEKKNAPKKLHENTLNYYYDLENIQDKHHTVLDMICKFLRNSSNSKNKYNVGNSYKLPHFNENILLLNIIYDLYIKQYIHEQCYKSYVKSNQLFLYSLMKYCYLLEYFSCLRSIVFLEICDFLNPFFEFIFKEMMLPIIDERNINTIFRHCVYSANNNWNNNTNQSIYETVKKSKVEASKNFSCATFIHIKFTDIHKRVLFYTKRKRRHKRNGRRKRILKGAENDKVGIKNRVHKKRKEIDKKELGNKDNSNKKSLDIAKIEKVHALRKKKISSASYTSDTDVTSDTVDSLYSSSSVHTNGNVIDHNDNNNSSDSSATASNTNSSNSNSSSSFTETDEEMKSTMEVEKSKMNKKEAVFYSEERLTNILKNFYFKLKENKIYDNTINVIHYRNLTIETKNSSFINFLIDNSSLDKYSAIFSYILEIKKSLQILKVVHIFYKYVKTKKPTYYEKFHGILLALCIFKAKLFFFLNTLYTYYLWVLDFSWNHFICNTSKAKSIEYIKTNHEYYLNFLIEALLIPIKTHHKELYNFYVKSEHKNTNDYKKFEVPLFRTNIQTMDSMSIIPHKTDKTMEPENNYKENTTSTACNNVKKENIQENQNAQNSVNKQFLLNELFSNNILNLISIPTHIYNILKTLSKHFHIRFDLNFDNIYDSKYEDEERDRDVDDNEEEEEEEEYYNKLGREREKSNHHNLHTDNDDPDASKDSEMEEEQLLSLVKNDLTLLSRMFEIHFSEFMKKLNIVSFNVDDTSFFGPLKHSKICNHILRLDKHIIKKISILEILLSFNVQNLSEISR